MEMQSATNMNRPRSVLRDRAAGALRWVAPLLALGMGRSFLSVDRRGAGRFASVRRSKLISHQPEVAEVAVGTCLDRCSNRAGNEHTAGARGDVFGAHVERGKVQVRALIADGPRVVTGRPCGRSICASQGDSREVP